MYNRMSQSGEQIVSNRMFALEEICIEQSLPIVVVLNQFVFEEVNESTLISATLSALVSTAICYKDNTYSFLPR